MINDELYINGKLIDTGGDLGVRISRKLIDPNALNTVDAQFSYLISLPKTPDNDEAFNYASIEETRNKFNRTYRAEYISNTIRIFGPGLFRLTSVSEDGYKGQLYLPAVKSVKDIFGETKLNENAPFELPFLDFAEYVGIYNNAAAITPQPAIFPYILYGLLPKEPINRDTNQYSARTLWDSTVKMGMPDLPPAINPLIMLQHIFSSRGYTLQGTAFQDEKLRQLYQSYRNSPDYVQPWNYGRHGTMHVTGQWSNWGNRRNPGAGIQYEKGVNRGEYQDYIVDLFDATNTLISVMEDPGGNVLYKENVDNQGRTWVNCQMRIPATGFYKVEFNGSIHLATDEESIPKGDPDTNVTYISAKSDLLVADMTNTLFELRLSRDNGQGDFRLTNAKTDGQFYQNNQPQNVQFDSENIPKYFPQVNANGQVNFVDKLQDKNVVLGFMFGRVGDAGTSGFTNPKDDNNRWAQVYAAKPALSYDNASNDGPPTRLAIKSPGWWKYGQIGSFDEPTEDPNKDIDYSTGTRVTGKVLDENGNPVNALGGNLDVRMEGYSISAITGFQTPAVDWVSSDFIDLREYTSPTFSGEVEETDSLAVVAFYDENKQFIGVGIAGDADATYIDEPIVSPAEAVFFRVCSLLAGTPALTIEAGSATLENVILERFQLERFYTYTFIVPGDSNYSGNVYLFDGDATFPTLVVPVVDNEASFDTSMAPISGFNPRVTLYLKTSAFDVDGTLIINRKISYSSEIQVDWELTNKYKIDLNNAPLNYARRGEYGGAPADMPNNGQGSANAVVWFEAGELVTVAVVSSEGQWRNQFYRAIPGYVRQNLLFDVKLTPFRQDAEWLKVNYSGEGTAVMNWNDAANFSRDSIDLVKFLDADMKTDDYIENFRKAFNLRLSQISATTFSLDVKQSKTATSNLPVDLDALTNVKRRENTPLGLPSQYVLGFTINTDEEGFANTGETGGGTYSTGATESNVVTQTSTFSYNWYKAITKAEIGGNIVINLPVISKAEAWALSVSYPEAMAKRYTDLAARFMYFNGILPGTYAYNGDSLQIAAVRNDLPGVSILNYKDQLYTILRNYFSLLISGASHYTNLKATIPPLIYVELDGTRFIRFNGDIYYIAEIGAYDPHEKNESTIKLIRKI